MRAEDYDRIHRILDQARKRDGPELESFLEEACGSDEALRASIEELLAVGANERVDELFERVPGRLHRRLAGPHDGEDVSWQPERVGDYRVLRRIGQGGMGIVYEAEQASPRRRVAIKLIHPLHVTPERLRRFRREAGLLGRLQHPGIAQIFEAGTYDLGHGSQPFFAMELVEGVDIRTYCRRERLGLREQIELLARVADAVHFAHERGVVHRDLKPDNVLVDGDGRPRVLDFGIARVTAGSASLTTLVSEDSSIVGTLPYMAPEQLDHASDDVTPRVDVYALGTLSFEVLVGRLPHQIEDLSLSRAITVLATQDAPRAGTLVPDLRGDIESILGKALESDPRRRYASAAELAGDLRRHLDHRPIHARPPSRLYLARKFTRRHRGLVGGAVATLVTLLVGGIASLFFALQARTHKDVAEENEARATNRLVQASQLLLDAGRDREALDQLRLIPEEQRGHAWNLLRRALPAAPAGQLSTWCFVDDEHIIGSFLERSGMEASETALHAYSLIEERTVRIVFEGAEIEKIESLDASGPIVVAKSATEYMLLDLEREEVLKRWPRHQTEGELEPPPGLSWRNGRRDPRRVTTLRIPSASRDGRAVLHYTGPHEAIVTVDGQERWRIDGLGTLETARIDRDGRILIVNRRESVEVFHLETRDLLFRYAPPPGAWASAVPVTGGVVLSNFPDTRKLGIGWPLWKNARAWRRFELSASPEPIRPADPFADALVFPEDHDGARAALSGDGRRLVRSYLDGLPGRVLLADIASGAPLDLPWLPRARGGHASWIETPHIPYAGAWVSPGGKRVLLANVANDTQLVELDPRESSPAFHPRGIVIRGHADAGGVTGGWVHHLAMSHDGSLIATEAPMDPFLRLWDVRTGELVARLQRRPSHSPHVGEILMAFEEGDDRLLVGMFQDREAVLTRWGLTEGSSASEALVPAFDSGTGWALPLIDAFIEELEPARRARLNQRTQLLEGRALTAHFYVRMYGDNGSYVWPHPTGGAHWTAVPGFAGTASGLSVHPTEARVAVVRQYQTSGFAADRKGEVAILDGQPLELLTEHPLQASPWCIAYSPDGTTLAIGTNEGRVILFEAERMIQQLDFRAHDSYVYSITWTPDGTRLVTASGDSTVMIWDSRTRVASRLADERWRARRESMATRGDLEQVFDLLEGEDRQAARIELIRRAHARKQ